MENEEKTYNPQEMATEDAAVENGENPVETEKVEGSLESYGNSMDAVEKYEDFAKTQLTEDGELSEGEVAGADSDILKSSEKGRMINILAENKKKIMIVAAMIVCLIMIAASVNYILNGGNKKGAETSSSEPDTVIESSFEAMENVKSYSYDGKVKFTYTFKNESAKTYDADFEAKYKGVFEEREPEKRFFYSDIAYNSIINVGERLNETSFDVESASINNKEYLRLNNFGIKGASADAKISKLEDSLKECQGKWYVVSSEDNRKFSERMGSYFSLPAYIGSASEINRKSADGFDKIFSNAGILKVSEKLGDEKIEDVDTVHYGVALNSQEALKVVVELMEMQVQQGGLDENGRKVLEELKSNANDSGKLKEMIDYLLRDVDFEIWIGKSDNFVYRFRLSGSFDKTFIQEFASKLKEVYGDAYSADADGIPDVNFGFDFDYAMSKFNMSQVREPADAKDFKEVMDKFEAAGPASAAVPSSAAVDTDGDGLSDEQEKFYGSDSAKTDTDGDGYKDGDEVRNGYDPVVAGSARLDYSKLPQAK